MSNDNKSIHEFDFNLICEYYSNVERQGPGSPETTAKAFSFIEGLTKDSRIADIGCGTGGQTMTMSKLTEANITGVDLFQLFIDKFNTNATKHGVQNRVKGIVASMHKLPFKEAEYDLLWSEGAIYNIGFEEGLKVWHKFIKPGGYIAVSEATWFTNERPKEINDFWEREYPGIDTIPNKVKQMQEVGYIPVASFIIPDNCWTEHFYEPQVEVQKLFLEKYKGNNAAEELIANQNHEAELYNKYKDYYGYVFYIGKKI